MGEWKKNKKAPMTINWDFWEMRDYGTDDFILKGGISESRGGDSSDGALRISRTTGLQNKV